MADIIAFLFGHTADVWTQGNFAFQTRLGGFAIIGGVVLLIFFVLILYQIVLKD